MSVSVATAIASHQTGEVERAEELYRQILAENPQEAAALHGLGMIAYQQQQYERAIEQIEQAIALDQSHAAYHNTLGMAYRAQGHLDKSLAAYRQGLLLDPDSNALQGNFTQAGWSMSIAIAPPPSITWFNSDGPITDWGTSPSQTTLWTSSRV